MRLPKPFDRFKMRHFGYMFLTIMILNALVFHILGIIGFGIELQIPGRAIIMLQIIGISLLSWTLGWVAGHEAKDEDEK